MSTEPRMTHFLRLTPAEQRAAIRRMAASGFGIYVISSATGLSVEAVRLIIGPIKNAAAGGGRCGVL